MTPKKYPQNFHTQKNIYISENPKKYRNSKFGTLTKMDRAYVCMKISEYPPGHNTYIHTYIHTHARTYIHTYIHTHVHTYMHAYIHTYIHTYMAWHDTRAHACESSLSGNHVLKCFMFHSIRPK